MQTRVNTPKAGGSGPAQSKPSSARPPQKVRKKEKINKFYFVDFSFK